MGEPTNGGAQSADAGAEAKAPVKYPQGPMDAISAGAWMDLKVRLAAQIMGGAAAAEVVKAVLAQGDRKLEDGSPANAAARAAAEFALETARCLIGLAEDSGLVVPLADTDGGAWLYAVHQRGAATLGAFDAEMRVGANRYAEIMQAAIVAAQRTAGPRIEVPNKGPGATLAHGR